MTTAIEKNFSHPAINNVEVELSVELGATTLRVSQLLKLGRGAVVELERHVDDPIEVYANDIMIAKASIIVTDNDLIGVTITDITQSS